jgi:hypothetical protein
MLQFVSAFMDLREDRYTPETKTIDRYFELFDMVAKTGVPIHVFVQKHLFARLVALSYPNVTVEVLEFEELDTYKTVAAIPDVQMPSERNQQKDTRAYLTFINAKFELVGRAMKQYPNATHFAWLDFGIAHVFRRPTETLSYLNDLRSKTLNAACLYIPGCWESGVGIHYVDRCVNWRFCGGFFLGDRDSVQRGCDLYEMEFGRIITESKTLVWEVNIWAIFEARYGWRPTWYKANHDDSIVRIPSL